MAFDYNAFLCYHPTDGNLVKAIASRLTQEAQLQVLLGSWHLTPEESWQDEIEHSLGRCATCVIFFNPHTPPDWLHPQLQTALEFRATKYRLRIIPVQLPGVDEQLKQNLPSFLQNNAKNEKPNCSCREVRQPTYNQYLERFEYSFRSWPGTIL